MLRLLLTLYVALTAVTIRYHPISTGLDGAWAYGVNLFAARGLIFGRDVGFTYGPLSYLTLPMNLGSNLAQGIAFQFCVWLLFAGTIVWAALVRRVALAGLTLFAALLFAGLPTFGTLGYAGPDLFAAYTALLLLGCAAVARRWVWPFCAAVTFAALLFLVKCSSAILVWSALLIFAGALSLRDRRKGAQAALLAIVAVPLACAVGYLLYFPSFDALWCYTRLGFEISSGYSSAMSYPSGDDGPQLALALSLIYALACVYLLWRKHPGFALCAAMAGPLFLSFKHSFVREPGHSGIFASFFVLTWALIVLFVEVRGRDRWVLATALLLSLGGWLQSENAPALWKRALETSAGLQSASSLASIWRVPAIRRSLDAQVKDELAADKLPPALLQRLGNESTGIFPSELTYAAANPIRYQPFPIAQTYGAYTTFLDNWNAAAVASTGAPSRIVFEWEAIDQRHPLLDVPAMSLELLRRYELDSAYNGVLLLRRRPQPAFQITRQIASTTLRIAEPFRVPDSEQPLIARIHLRYTPGGRFRRFAFRIPEVRVLIHTAAGRTLSARVPPEVLDNGIPLNLLPFDLNDFRTLISGQRIDPVQSLTIGGEGARYFEPNVSAELLEISDWTLQPAAPPVALHSRGSLDSIQVETINDTNAAGRGEVIPIRDRYGFVQIRGWALDGLRGQIAGGVQVLLDGVPYYAQYGTGRPDVAALQHCPECLASGFDWAIAAHELGHQPHVLTFRILHKDGVSYYDTDRAVRFRIE